MPPLVLAAALLEGYALTLIQGFLPLYMRRSLGETSFLTVGAIVAIPAIGTMVASNFWGGLSDVHGRLKPVILVGLAGYALALGGLPLVPSGAGVVVWVALASLLYGTLAPSLKTYVTLARPGRREHALAFLLMFQSTGWFLGSITGSWLMNRSIGEGLRTGVWVCAAALVIHAALSTRWLPDLRREAEPPRAPRGWIEGIVADLAALYENPRLLRLCLLALFCVAGNYVFWGFFSVFYTEHLGAAVPLLGVTLAASSVLGIISFLYVGPLVQRLGGQRVLVIGTSLYVAMYAAMAVLREPVAVGVLFAMPVYGLIHVSTNTLAAEYSGSARRGGGLGILNGAYALATLVGPLCGGLLADRYGLGAIPWISLAFLTVASGIAWLHLARPGRPAADSGRIPD